MTSDERRKAIVEAVVPLVIETGAMPTTREIARAAGVAEGTIFRVFDDKPALLHALAEHVLDPPGADERFRAMVDGAPDLRGALRLVVERMQETSSRVTAILMVVRQSAAIAHLAKPAAGPPGPPEFLLRANETLLERLTYVFALHDDELRVEPTVAATVLRGLVFGSQHPGMTGPAPLTPDQIVDAVLHGVARKDSPCC
jgi:AcrR family transcriptional regulator